LLSSLEPRCPRPYYTAACCSPSRLDGKPGSRVDQLPTRYLDETLTYCQEKVPFGVVEVINGNLRAMLRRGRGYGIMSTC